MVDNGRPAKYAALELKFEDYLDKLAERLEVADYLDRLKEKHEADRAWWGSYRKTAKKLDDLYGKRDKSA